MSSHALPSSGASAGSDLAGGGPNRCSRWPVLAVRGESSGGTPKNLGKHSFTPPRAAAYRGCMCIARSLT